LRKTFLFGICTLVLCVSCTETYDFVGEQIIVPIEENAKEDIILKDSTSNFLFSRIQGSGATGLFTYFKIPFDNQNKELWIVFQGRLRSNLPQSHAAITVSGSNDSGEVLSKDICPLRYFVTETNKWCHFKDSVFLKSKLNFRPYNIVHVYALLENSYLEAFDIDTLRITIRQKNSWL
jgi:hypothetical protein